MPRFLIERAVAGANRLTSSELRAMSQRSRDVLLELGPAIQWIQSFVTDDRIVCTYIAPNAEIIREHARRAGFPAVRVDAIRAVIDPVTADD